MEKEGSAGVGSAFIYSPEGCSVPSREGRNRWQCGRWRRGGACMGGSSTLRDCPARSWAEIRSINEGSGCTLRLRELGALDGVKVYIIKQSDPMLILVDDTRIAIDCETASCINVRRASQP